MATTTTTNLSMTLAVPGTNEPFSTAVVNANFEAIDAEVGTQRTTDTTQNNRLTTIEKLTLPSASTPTTGVIPAGTTAQRDAFWGTPSSATQKSALANRGARWFNTEKHYEERYYCLTGTSGLTVRGLRAGCAEGWYPAPREGVARLLHSNGTQSRASGQDYTLWGATTALWGSALGASGSAPGVSGTTAITINIEGDYDIRWRLFLGTGSGNVVIGPYKGGTNPGYVMTEAIALSTSFGSNTTGTETILGAKVNDTISIRVNTATAVNVGEANSQNGSYLEVVWRQAPLQADS